MTTTRNMAKWLVKGPVTSLLVLTWLIGPWDVTEVAAQSPQLAWTPTSTSSSDLFTYALTNCTWDYCRGNHSDQACNCKKDCWKTNNCCLDFWTPEVEDNLHPTPGPDTLAKVDAIPYVRPRTCEQYLVGWTKVKKTVKQFLMVTSCPTTTHPGHHSSLHEEEEGSLKEVQRRCESKGKLDDDFLQLIPVYSPATLLTYRNVYCASCNNDVSNFLYWNATVRCKNTANVSTILDAVQNKKDCGLEVRPPRQNDSQVYQVTLCKGEQTMITKCNTTWNIPGDPRTTQRVHTLCRVINAKVKIQDQMYRNAYCALCNDAISPESANVTCSKPESSQCFNTKQCLPDTTGSQIKSFVVLFDVNYGSQGAIVGVKTLCPVGNIYDPVQGQCKRIYCSPPYRFEMDRCVISDDTGEVPAPVRQSHLTCPKILMFVNGSDIQVDTNRTLTLKSGQQYAAGDYEYSNGTLMVCADLSQNYVTWLPGAAFEVLTVVGLSLSLVALAIKMFLYFAMPETRTFPDRIVFCLSVVLFAAQFLFIAGLTATSNYSLCATIGVLMHYAFLSTFCWMCALAYDVCCTFGNLEAPFLKAQSNHCRFLKYSMFAWVTPALVVFLASIFDWVPTSLSYFSPLRPYYGQAICYISSRPALLVYFVGPVAILLAIIVCLFVVTSCHICISSRQTAMAQMAANATSASVCHRTRGSNSGMKAHHLNFCLYLKLGAILGLTWLSGFVAAYTQVEALWYIYILLNTGQGIYILLAFTPFQKVKRCMQRHIQHKVFYRNHPPSGTGSASSHKALQRSSTRSSQMTTVSSTSTVRTSFLSAIIKE